MLPIPSFFLGKRLIHPTYSHKAHNKAHYPWLPVMLHLDTIGSGCTPRGNARAVAVVAAAALLGDPARAFAEP